MQKTQSQGALIKMMRQRKKQIGSLLNVCLKPELHHLMRKTLQNQQWNNRPLARLIRKWRLDVDLGKLIYTGGGKKGKKNNRKSTANKYRRLRRSHKISGSMCSSSSDTAIISRRREADKAPPLQQAIILHFILFEKSLIISFEWNQIDSHLPVNRMSYSSVSPVYLKAHDPTMTFHRQTFH